MKKKPRFYCDNCGYEVGSDVKTCPYCARYFASVRCPMCGFSGPDKMFLNGCAMCGYSAPKFNPKNTKMKPARFSGPNEPLPFWTYFIAVFILLAMIALFSYLITK
ncbi:MAG: hypothetical protein FWC22_08445 [Treponema sp.]|nr:hypothetical protein [Treponema sp.]